MNTYNASWQVPQYRAENFYSKARRYCVVIPVINEGDRIQSLLQRMKDLEISEIADVIIVDGGSTDGSLAHGFLQAHGVRTIVVKLGAGKLSAQLRCGYAFALEEGYDGIVTIDGNNKDDPDPIARFIATLAEGVDFVQASRFLPGALDENTPTSRRLAIKLLHAPVLSLASGFKWTDTTQGFRAYSRRLLMDPRVAPFRHVFLGYELLAYLSYRAPKLGFRCMEMATARRYPKGKVPTKIAGWRGQWDLIKVLFAASTGRYDPAES